MRMHYTSTLAVSSEKVPTCGQILPILQKLRKHYTVQTDDSAFVSRTSGMIFPNVTRMVISRHSWRKPLCWIPDLNLKWTWMTSGTGSGHQQWQQTQRQWRSCQSQERHRGRQKKRMKKKKKKRRTTHL